VNSQDVDFGGCVSDASFWYPDRLAEDSAWIEHIPFAFWLIGAFRPQTVVELGTYSGNSFFAFCQAAKMHGTSTYLSAVDTWAGDDHVGNYDNTIYQDVSKHHEINFRNNSNLMRCTFDDARKKFEPGSVDLLHIDGLHTYDAVRHDFDTWVSAMSERGIILFHDIAVRTGDFGVWQLWAEISSKYPSFDFSHGNGLGILNVGGSIAKPTKKLFDLSADQAKSVRQLYLRLGQSVVDWRSRSLMANKKLEDIESSRSWKIAETIARTSKWFK